MTQVGEAFVSIKADMSGFDNAVRGGVESAMKDAEKAVSSSSKRISDSLQDAGARIGDVGKRVSDVGGSLTKNVTLPIVGIGTAAFAAAQSVDDALDEIRVGTGATGETLAQLEDDFEALARTSSRGIDRVGTVVADLNTRLGLTGEPMRQLAGQVLDLEQILGGTEISLDTLTRVFGAFRVEPENYTTVLDQLFRASQATGVQFDTLQGLVVGQSAAFGELGFDLTETIAILGQFEKAGVNTETVLGGLRANIIKSAKGGDEYGKIQDKLAKAQGKVEEQTLKVAAAQAKYDESLQKHGPTSSQALSAQAALVKAQNELTDNEAKIASYSKTLDEAFKNSGASAKGAAEFFRAGVKQIEEYLAAGDDAGAQAAAKELFGARTFLDALDAIRRGQFNIDGTVDQIVNGGDTISALADETADFAEKFQEFRNRVTLSLAPLGEKLMPLLIGVLDRLVPVIDKVVTAFSNMSPTMKTVIGVIAGVVAALGPVLFVVGKVIAIGGTLVATVGKIAAGIGLLFTPVGAIVVGIAALVAIIIIVVKNFDSIKEAIGGVIDAIGNFISGALQFLMNTFTGLWETVRNVWDSITNAIETAISFVVGTVFAMFHGALDGIMIAFTAVKEFITTTIGAIASVIRSVFAGIANFFSTIMETISGIITTAIEFIWTLFMKYLDMYRAAFRIAFDAIRTIVRTVLRAIRQIITTVFDRISEIISTVLGTIQTVVSEVFGFIEGVITTVVGTISRVVTDTFNGIKRFITDILNDIKTVFEGIWNGLSTFVTDVIGGIYTFITDTFDDVVQFFAGIPGRIWNVASGMFNGIKEAFRDAINFVIRGWNRIEFRIPGFRIGPVGYSGFTLGLPDIPELANGGIITQPTLAIVGEAGPEAVVPLSRPNRARQIMNSAGLSGAGALVNIERATFMDGTDADLVAQKVNAAYRSRVLVA